MNDRAIAPAVGLLCRTGGSDVGYAISVLHPLGAGAVTIAKAKSLR